MKTPGKMFSDYLSKLIAPEKVQYDSRSIQPPSPWKRTTEDITTAQGYRLRTHLMQKNESDQLLLYLHGYASSSLEGYTVFLSLATSQQTLAQMNMSVCFFDFTACGCSQGETVTFGWNEQNDVQTVVEHLYSKYKFKSLILWGRSMGASTALLWVARYKSPIPVIAIVSDSAFIDLGRLVREKIKEKVKLPEFALKAIFREIRNKLIQMHKTDLELLNLTQFITNIKLPTLFVYSKEDEFISYQHTEDIISIYNKQCQRHIITGSHNCTRQKLDLAFIMQFIKDKINQKMNERTIAKQAMRANHNNKAMVQNYASTSLMRSQAESRKQYIKLDGGYSKSTSLQGQSDAKNVQILLTDNVKESRENGFYPNDPRSLDLLPKQPFGFDLQAVETNNVHLYQSHQKESSVPKWVSQTPNVMTAASKSRAGAMPSFLIDAFKTGDSDLNKVHHENLDTISMNIESNLFGKAVQRGQQNGFVENQTNSNQIGDYERKSQQQNQLNFSTQPQISYVPHFAPPSHSKPLSFSLTRLNSNERPNKSNETGDTFNIQQSISGKSNQQTIRDNSIGHATAHDVTNGYQFSGQRQTVGPGRLPPQ